MAYQPAVICQDCKHQLGCCVWFARKLHDPEHKFLWGFQEERCPPFILLSQSLLISKNRSKWQLSLRYVTLFISGPDNENIQSFQQPFWCLHGWNYCSSKYKFKKCFAYSLHLCHISVCLGMTIQYLLSHLQQAFLKFWSPTAATCE